MSEFSLDDSRQKAFAEADAFQLPEGWLDGRPLVRGITIDSEHTRDCDDAIWLQPYENGVAIRVSIADVGNFLGDLPAVAAYAQEQAETRYLRTRNIPMIPPAVSEGSMSLLPGQSTPVISIELALDKAANVQNSKFEYGTVDPRRMTYHEVNRLTSGKGAGPEIKALKYYEATALKLLSYRAQRGAFAFYDPSAGFMTNEEGILTPIERGVNHSGQVIVQEFMILANTAVAEYMLQNGIPAIYRNHAMRHPMSMDEAVQAMVSGQADRIELLKQGFGRARYETTPTGHAGLNLEAYLHWTSPLRRFVDFANHANLAAFANQQPYPYPLERLGEIAQHCNFVQDSIREAKAKHFKDVDRASTVRQLGRAAQELDKLDDDTFYKVVKVMASTGTVTPELLGAVSDRASRGQLGSRELETILFSQHRQTEAWQPLNQSSIAALVDNPPHAISVLSSAQINGRLAEQNLAVTGQGTDFECSGRIVLADGSEFSVKTNASSKRKAHQLAAIQLLATMNNVAVSDDEIERLSAGSELPKPREETNASANPKGLLNEFCQQGGLMLPDYQTIEIANDGVNHIFESTVRVILAGEAMTFTGQGSNIKSAEAAAAAMAVTELNISIERKVKKTVVSNNAISVLQERSQMLRQPSPSYQFSQHGPGHSTVFECQVTVYDEAGKPLSSFTGSGSSKQAAKLEAAAAALESFL